MSNYRIERELSAGVFVLYDTPKDTNHSLEIFNSFPVESAGSQEYKVGGGGAFVLK